MSLLKAVVTDDDDDALSTFYRRLISLMVVALLHPRPLVVEIALLALTHRTLSVLVRKNVPQIKHQLSVFSDLAFIGPSMLVVVCACFRTKRRVHF